MKSTVILAVLIFLMQGCGTHKNVTSKNTTAALIGSWQFFDNKISTNPQPFKAEDFPTVRFFDNQQLTMNFLKNESGTWQLDKDNHTLQIHLPNEKIEWTIAKIEKDRISIKGKGVLVRIGTY